MNDEKPENVRLITGDALIVVDVQKDFLPSGNLPVARGDEVIAAFNRYLAVFRSEGLPVYATRDWHPPDHCSFEKQGGPWPPHCIVDTEGAQFASGLDLPSTVTVISTATETDREAYSGFEGTDLDERLRTRGLQRLLIGGLATDYCVLNTVRDALKLDYSVFLLEDAIRAVNVNPEDGRKAIEAIRGLGAIPIRFEKLE